MNADLRAEEGVVGGVVVGQVEHSYDLYNISIVWWCQKLIVASWCLCITKSGDKEFRVDM